MQRNLTKPTFKLSVLVYGALIIIFCLILFTALDSFSVYAEKPVVFAVLFGVVLVAAAALLLCSLVRESISVRKEIIAVLVLILAGSSLRVISYMYFQTIPISDFADAESHAMYFLKNGAYPPTDFSKLTYDQLYMARFTAYAFYAITVKGIYSLFGVGINRIIAVNILCAAISCVVLYLAAKNMTKSRRMAWISCATYTFWPSSIVFSGVLSPDNIAVTFLSLFLYVCSRMENIDRKRYLYVHLAAAGLCVGFFNAYREFGDIFLIAFFIVLLIYSFTGFCEEAKNGNIKISSEKCAYFIAAFTVFFIASRLPAIPVKAIVESQIGTPVINLGHTGKFFDGLYIGLNADSNGGWTQNLYEAKFDVYSKYGGGRPCGRKTTGIRISEGL